MCSKRCTAPRCAGSRISRVQGHGGELDRVETYRGTTVQVGSGGQGPVRDRRLRRRSSSRRSTRSARARAPERWVTARSSSVPLERVVRIRTGETDHGAVTPVGGMSDLPWFSGRWRRWTRGDTAWMLAATALVLLMTPALGLFYAGLVRSKNTLNTFMMCIAAIAVATVTWALVGYSLAFDGTGDFIGGFDNAFLHDVDLRAARRDDDPRTASSWPSRRPSASSPPRWCRAPWWSGCASARSSSSPRCGRCSSTP